MEKLGLTAHFLPYFEKGHPFREHRNHTIMSVHKITEIKKNPDRGVSIKNRTAVKA